jgi:hypothetical protein
MPQRYVKSTLASVSAFLLAIALTACSIGGNSSVVPPSANVAPEMRAPDRPFQYALVADTVHSIIYMFGPDGRRDGTITDGLQSPSGLYVDSKGNLWVANSVNVLFFPRGATAPTRTLSDPKGFPGDVSVGTDGTVYVANFETPGQGSYGPGNVSVYPSGRDKPARTLHDPNAQYDVSVTSDAAGNVFTTINDYTGVGYVDEFVGGRQSGFKRLPMVFSFADTIRLDNAGNLVVLDQVQHLIREFTELGKPTAVKFHTKANWTSFALNRTNTLVLGAVDNPDTFKAVSVTFPQHQPVRNYQVKGLGAIGGVAFIP